MIKKIFNEPIQKRLLVLTGLFLFMIVLQFGMQEYTNQKQSKLKKEMSNQDAHLQLSNILLLKLLRLETEFLKLNEYRDLRDVSSSEKNFADILKKLQNLIDILQHGGRFADLIEVNFYNINEFKEEVCFQGGDSSKYNIAVIELTPKIMELEVYAKEMVGLKRQLLAKTSRDRDVNIQEKIDLLFKKANTLLIRSKENANKIKYDVGNILGQYRLTVKSFERKLNLIRDTVSLVLLIVFFAVLLRTIKSIQLLLNEKNNAHIELKQTFETTDRILEEMPIGMMIVNKEKKIVRMNECGKKLIGVSDEKSYIGKVCHEFVCSANRNSCPMMDCHKKIQSEEKELITMSREKVPVIKSVIPITMHGEEMLLELFYDIREQKEAKEVMEKYQERLEIELHERTLEIQKQKEVLERVNQDLMLNEQKLKSTYEKLFNEKRNLEQTQAQLLQAEKMASIGQLAAGVAHEINNPIGFINSNLSTISEYIYDIKTILLKYSELEKFLENKMDAGHSEFLGKIQKLKKDIDLEFILKDFDKAVSESKDGAVRVKNIVQDLKTFSHIDESEIKEVDINQGIESTLNIVWNELKYKVRVIKDLQVLPLVKCYPQQINQVIMNLLVNAGHAIHDKGEIKIATYCDEKDVFIEIADTGEGIKPENLKKVFDPFFTTKEVGKGTGLGLSMSYNIVKKHGGVILVDSEIGKGTTFTVKLPLL